MWPPDFYLNFVTCSPAQIADGCMQNSFANFSLSLINTKKKQYETLGWWIVLLNGATLAYIAISVGGDQQKVLLVYGLFLPLILLPLNRLWAKKRAPHYSDLTLFYIFPCFAWAMAGFYKSAGILLILFLLFKISLRPLRVRFTEQGIDYPSFPRKKIEWKKMVQVIVKDDLLTIDLRSNELMQQPIEKDSFIDEREVAEFNAHCQQKINLV
jgi:hypothetical protein